MSTILTHEVHPGGAIVVTIQGRLDAFGAQQTEAALAAAIGDHAGPVVLDLRAVDYISSSGLAMLIVRGRALLERGGSLLIGGASPRVREVLALVGFEDLFPLYDTPQAALTASE